MLNKHFYSIFTTDNGDVTPEFIGASYPPMPDVEMDIAGVARLLSNIDSIHLK